MDGCQNVNRVYRPSDDFPSQVAVAPHRAVHRHARRERLHVMTHTLDRHLKFFAGWAEVPVVTFFQLAKGRNMEILNVCIP